MLKFLICLLIFGVGALAQEPTSKKTSDSGTDENELSREKLIIAPFQSQLVSSYDQEYVNRIAARIVAKQQKYHLVISKEIDDGSKLSGVITLKIDLFEEGDKNLRLEAKLVDNNRNATIKRVLKEGFPPEQFKLVAEMAILVLFGLEEEYAASIKVRPRDTKEKPEVESVKEDKSLVDFRKRVLDLKNGIKMEFKILDAKQKVEGQGVEGFPGPEKPKNEEAPIKTLIAFQEMENVYAPRGPQKIPNAHTIFNWYAIGAGASDFLVKDRAGSEIEVVLRTNLNYLYGNIYTEIWPPYFSQHAYFVRLGVKMPVFYSEEISPDTTPELDLGFLGAYFGENLYLKLGVRKETYTFANLPKLGGGIQLANVDVTWGMASFHLLFWDRNLYIKHETASQLSSDFNGSTFTDGSLVILKNTSRIGVAAGWFATGSYLELAFQTTEFQATGVRDIAGEDKSTFLMWQLPF